MANSIRTLNPELSPEALRKEIVHTLVLLQKENRYPNHISHFQALEGEWWLHHKKSMLLRDSVLAHALDVDMADESLNEGSDEVAKRMEKAFDGNREHPVFLQHFGVKRPSAFKRPILGSQLDSMEGWPVSLASLPHESLSSYAPIIADKVNFAKSKRDLFNSALNDENIFYVSGDYKLFVDKVNAARASLLGDAAAFAHSHPELELPKDYAPSFFLRNEGTKEPSLGELDKDIASLEARLTQAKQKRQSLLDAAALSLAQQKQAEKQAKLAMLAEAQKQAASAQAALLALQSELDALNVP